MLMPSPDHERHDRYIARYLETGEAKIIGIGRDIVALRKDGTTFPARLSVSEFESHGRRYFTGMLHDISERVDAEEQRRALFAEHAHTSRVIALGEMASGIAHEINQPLTAIVSFADASRRLIQTRRDDTDSLNRALRQISDQAQRAGDIIRRLRDFVKKKEPKRVPLDVNELIMAAVEMTSHDAERNGISLTVDFGTNPLHALVDRLQIEQVVLNLIRNSIDSVNESGGQDGSIEVRSGLDDGMAVIAVSDNGVGIKASELASVFKPFYTTKGKGTGLGLSISRSIAEAHDGELSLDADLERGATFILRLPAHADG
jgi:two-component system sensor kinase FixL